MTYQIKQQKSTHTCWCWTSSSIPATSFSLVGTCSANRFSTVATASCDLPWLNPVLRLTCSTITAPSPSSDRTSSVGLQALESTAFDCSLSGLGDKSAWAMSDDEVRTEFAAFVSSSSLCRSTAEENPKTLPGGCGAVDFCWLLFASTTACMINSSIITKRPIKRPIMVLKNFTHNVEALLWRSISRYDDYILTTQSSSTANSILILDFISFNDSQVDMIAPQSSKWMDSAKHPLTFSYSWPTYSKIIHICDKIDKNDH